MLQPNCLEQLLALVREAARAGVEEALAKHVPVAAEPAPLVDKQGLARALDVSTGTIDRLCRDERIPFVLVGESKRFDLAAVRAALAADAPPRDTPTQAKTTSIAGVRPLSRRPARGGPRRTGTLPPMGAQEKRNDGTR